MEKKFISQKNPKKSSKFKKNEIPKFSKRNQIITFNILYEIKNQENEITLFDKKIGL